MQRSCGSVEHSALKASVAGGVVYNKTRAVNRNQ